MITVILIVISQRLILPLLLNLKRFKIRTRGSFKGVKLYSRVLVLPFLWVKCKLTEVNSNYPIKLAEQPRYSLAQGFARSKWMNTQ